MKSTIFIPKKIKVGYQERNDTYTKRLAYIIYYDEKGKLRKEASWKNWCQFEDKYKSVWENGKHVLTNEILSHGYPPDDFDNVPTEGFVLNKKAGGDKYGWNPRQTYCRVYDPRGFEFEIIIPNLLYILENTNSIKGKGLEGKFVYGWDGTQLVLIPEQAPEYVQLLQYSKDVKNKLSAKDLVVGKIYINKSLERMLYMGKYMTHTVHDTYTYGLYIYGSGRERTLISKAGTPEKEKFIFYMEQDIWENGSYKKSADFKKVVIKTTLPHLLYEESEKIYPGYPDLAEQLEHNSIFYPVVPEKTVVVNLTKEEILDKFNYYYFLKVSFSWQDKVFEGELYKTHNSCFSIRNIFNTTDNTYRLPIEINESLKEGSIEEMLKLYNFNIKKYFLSNGKEKFF